MVVVSDTSPIANLIVINRLDLLHTLFEEIIVPAAVDKEIRQLQQSGKNIQAYEEATWFKILEAKETEKVNKLKADLDAGEAEAIAIALELKCDLLLMDERLGTNIAEKEGLFTIGLLGLLIKAKQKGIINEIKPLMMDLKEKAGFWIGTKLFEQILRDEHEY